jgi:hypothetical protein
MAGSITVSSITLDSDNNFSIKSNTGATILSANGTGLITGIASGSAITNAQLTTPTVSGQATVNSGASASSVILNSTNAGGAALNIQNSGTVNALLGGYNSIVGSGNATDVMLSATQGVLAFGTGASSTERMRINEFGVGLGGAIPSSGTGITFPASQNPSSDANTLDDYEEGTWTPTIEGTSTAGTATYSNRNGQYTKIGRQVTVITYVSWNSGTGTGNLRMSGLPFTNNSGGVYGAVTLSEFDNIAMTANYYPSAYVEQGGTRIIFEQSPTGGGGTIGVPYDAAGAFILTATYFV